MFLITKNRIINILNDLNNWEIKNIDDYISYIFAKAFYEKEKLEFKNNKFDSKNFLITTIHNQNWNDVDIINNKFIELIWNNIKDKDFIANFYNIVWELLNNICHHSGIKDLNDNSWNVIISANYHSVYIDENQNIIQVIVVDSGKWILKSVREKIPKIKSAKEAILKALEPWFTGGTILKSNNYNWIYNAGIWLTVTYNIIKRWKWDLFIWTKDSLFSYDGKREKEDFIDIPNWAGTFIILNLYIDNLVGVNFMEMKKDLLINDDNENLDNLFF